MPNSDKRREIDWLIGSAAAAELADVIPDFPSYDEDYDLDHEPVEVWGPEEDKYRKELELEDWRKRERLKAIDGPKLLERLESGDVEGIEDDVSLVLERLSEREARIVVGRYLGLGENGPATLKVLGELYGITPARVKKVPAEATEKIRSINYSSEEE